MEGLEPRSVPYPVPSWVPAIRKVYANCTFEAGDFAFKGEAAPEAAALGCMDEACVRACMRACAFVRT